MEYISPKIRKLSFMALFLKLALTIGFIFLLSKMYHKLNLVEAVPPFLGTLLFIFVCLLTAWFYRVNYKLEFQEQHITLKLSYNLLGFVVIVATLNGSETKKIRLWNPSSYHLQLSEKYILKFMFKPSSSNPNTGCRLLVKDNAMKRTF